MELVPASRLFPLGRGLLALFWGREELVVSIKMTGYFPGNQYNVRLGGEPSASFAFHSSVFAGRLPAGMPDPGGAAAKPGLEREFGNRRRRPTLRSPDLPVGLDEGLEAGGGALPLARYVLEVFLRILNGRGREDGQHLSAAARTTHQAGVLQDPEVLCYRLPGQP